MEHCCQFCKWLHLAANQAPTLNSTSASSVFSKSQALGKGHAGGVGVNSKQKRHGAGPRRAYDLVETVKLVQYSLICIKL